jgi:multidrug transporter EmrE-like cation transporter
VWWGYGKTAAVLAAGILVFHDEFTMSILVGIVMVFVGAFFYNRGAIKTVEKS